MVFFKILVKLRRNFEEKWGILCTNFRHSKRKFRDIFESIFAKTYKELSEKQEITLRKF